MTMAKLQRAKRALEKPDTHIGILCKELGITPQTLYRHVCPKGTLRLDGEKALQRN